MCSTINLLCTVAILFTNWHGILAEGPPAAPTGMKLLGSSEEAGKQTSYYVTNDTAAWNLANSGCKTLLGEKAGLATLETMAEVLVVSEFLKKINDTSEALWIGGRYNKEKDAFEWINGVPFAQDAPWDNDYPDTKVPVTKVMLFQTNRGPKFRTLFQNFPHRYICELCP